MAVKDKVRRTVTCDRAGCKMEVEFNPQPGPNEQPPTKLNEIIAVTHLLSGTQKVYIGKECLKAGIEADEYLPSKLLKPGAPSPEQSQKVLEMIKNAKNNG